LKVVWSYSVPTAVQARSPEHETDTSQPFVTSGLGWIDQLVPFHTSTSGLVIPGGWSGSVEPILHWPTAKQTFRHGQETPESMLKFAPEGFGVGISCQLVPSQRSATVVTIGRDLNPVWVTALPTAMHEVAEVQSTPLRLVSFAPGTFGVGGTVHAAVATEGVSNNAAVAIKTRRTDRSDICPPTYASGLGGSSATNALSGARHE